MRTIETLDELAALVAAEDRGESLYLRWSAGPAADCGAGAPAPQTSRDSLTGVELPGLSASPLRVEPWWEDRPLRLWVARRLYDYRHLREQRGPHVRPWVMRGTERGRGPDNEPLVTCQRPLAWVSEWALGECERTIEAQSSDEWGSLRRS